MTHTRFFRNQRWNNSSEVIINCFAPQKVNTAIAPSASKYSLLVFCRPPLSLSFVMILLLHQTLVFINCYLFEEWPVVESDGRWYEKDDGEDEVVDQREFWGRSTWTHFWFVCFCFILILIWFFDWKTWFHNLMLIWYAWQWIYIIF